MWHLIIGFLAQIADIVFGVGFGTIMTPTLLSFNYPFYEVIVTLLLLQGITGLSAGLFYYYHGLINWREDKHLKPTIIIACLGISGAVIGAFLLMSINLLVIEVIISLIVIISGLSFFIKIAKKKKRSLKQLLFFTIIGSITKIMSGVYGPIITSGQVLSGYDPKKSVARTAFTEGLISLTGFAVLVFRAPVNWLLFTPLLIIMLITTLLSTYIVKISNQKYLRSGIGFFIIITGLILLVKTLS